VLERLGALVDQSLVQVRAEDGAEARFTMLETIREFAQEELAASGEEAATRAAHARYLVALVEEIYPWLAGPEQVQALARLAAEQDNLRTALRWLLEVDQLATVGRLLRHLARFWWIQGQIMEGRRWAEAVLARGAAAPTEARASACFIAGVAMGLRGDDGALALLAEARDLARAVGDRMVEGHSLALQGYLAPLRGDLAEGVALLRQGQQLLRETGEEYHVGFALAGLSALSVLRGELEEAEHYATDYVALAQRTGDLLSQAQSRDYLAIVALVRRDLDRVAALLAEAIPLALAVGQPVLVANGLMGLAVVAAGEEPARAARLFGAAEALRETAGVAIWEPRRRLYDPALERVRRALGTAAFDADWTAGRALTREQAVSYALEMASAPSVPGG
jgi:non-specific serine/threonine protein kinase